MAGASRQGMREEDRKVLMKPVVTRAVLLAIAVIAATVIMLVTAGSNQASSKPVEEVEETSKVTYIQARPSAEPTAEPVMNSIKVYSFGSELTADGFTAYVGDRAITLTVKIDPELSRPPVQWSLSDPDAARLAVSDDRMSCEFTPLKAAGKVELTVACYGMYTAFPVYIWER